MDIRKLALIVEYDGTGYYGFQVQRGLPTVQGEIERAIAKVTGEKVRVAGASRTDQGVHAAAQVVSFRTASSLAPETILRALNHYLPEDIVVREAGEIGLDFDVRRRAVSREYAYRMLNRRTGSPLMRLTAYHIPQPLDVEAMGEACRTLVGTHDFIGFASSLNGHKSTLRTVRSAEMERDGELVTFRVKGNSFLPHQVRNTMGALVKVGLGKSDVKAFRDILCSKEPGTAGPALPPNGLCLVKVEYSEGLM
ncbi:MAG: tRNA pseudouridine(38-40) synthase TruA [Chloroflexota bacterium]|nr:tRNA pseudouridine(38-40) synthase TruA [Chloroflexota bacterium]